MMAGNEGGTSMKIIGTFWEGKEDDLEVGDLVALDLVAMELRPPQCEGVLCWYFGEVDPMLSERKE